MDTLPDGVRRVRLADEEFGESRHAQIAVFTMSPLAELSLPAQPGERICVVVEGAATLHTDGRDRGAPKGTVVHSPTGHGFGFSTGTTAATLLSLSSADAVPRGGTNDADEPVRSFSLYDVEDEDLHRPAAGFHHMRTRMLLHAALGGHQAFIFGQSTFLPGRGVHALHRHPRADEMFYVWEGRGAHLTEDGTEHPMGVGDAVFVPRGEWHGFRNVGKRPVRAFFGLIGTGRMQDAGNELLEDGTTRDALATGVFGVD